jgi:putative DNA primase/helicase
MEHYKWGTTMNDLGEPVKIYDYTDESGNLLFQSCRYEPKDFRQRRPDGNGGWTWNLDGIKRVLYRRAELVSAPKDCRIAYTEGEKDADRLNEFGFEATTCPGGAGKHRPEYNQFFAGRYVDVFQDNDEAGRRHAQQVADSLYGIAAEVKIIELPGLRDKGDISDWLDAGHTKAELLKIIDDTKPFEPTKSNFPLTDSGNAERFAAMNGDKLRHCLKINRWYYFDGYCWNSELGEEMAWQSAIKTVRAIVKDADDVIGKTDRERILQFSLGSESAPKIRAMLSLAKTLPPIVCQIGEFDKDAFLFNCANGTIDLRTGELRERRPEDMITKLSPGPYIPGAKLPLFDDCLDSATGGDNELKDYLQKAFGYSMTGDTSEEVLFFVYGPTATGKTTMLESIKAAFGSYAMTTDFDTFLKRQQVGGTRNDIARLNGARFVNSVEIDEGRALAEVIIKQMTGGDTVSARFLYSEHTEFKPSFKLWLGANHAPKADDRDDALFRRIRIIPFTHTIPENERDPKVKQVLRDPKIAGPAILAWAVEGCLKWQREGLKTPASIREATQDYRDEQDPLRDFFNNEVEFDGGCYVGVTALRQRYDIWAKEVGLKFTLGPRQFNDRLQDKGCVRKVKEIPNDVGTIKATKCWLGVTLQTRPQYLQEIAECQQSQEKIPF